MSMNIRQFLGRLKLLWRGKTRIVGWNMTPGQAIKFFKRRQKTVLTFFGYSTAYRDRQAMLRIVRNVLFQHSPKTTLVNMGATEAGVGEAYPLIKSMGFETAGIVSSQALAHPESISKAVDYVCFIKDQQWGGMLPGSHELSPTSKAMVACSDILVAIGGNDISRDELLAGKALGKPIYYYRAEMDHQAAIYRARRNGDPLPKSFTGSVHEVFGKKG